MAGNPRRPSIASFILGGGLAPLISAGISALIVLWTVSCYDCVLKGSTPTGDFTLTTQLSQLIGIDPRKDHTFNLQAIGGIMGYVVMSTLCTSLDVLTWALGTAPSWKVQGTRSMFTPREWLTAFGVSALNMLAFSWLATVPSYHLQRSGLLRGGTPMPGFLDAWEPGAALAHIAAMGVFIDAWFYTTHRLLHWQPLYRSVHKLHHRFHAPASVASMFAHPLEYVVGNSLGVVLGPALTNCHPYTGCFWLAFSLVSTGGSHCG